MLDKHHQPRLRAVGALTLAIPATVALGVIAAPAQAADGNADGTADCSVTHGKVTGGSFEWGLKNSWRNYLQGPVAAGGWNLNGVGYTGSAFSFTPDTSSGGLGENGSGVLPLQGSLNFYGHGGALDMTLEDLALVVNGSSAGIRVDYVTYTSDFRTSGAKGERVTGNDVIIATINLDTPANPDSGSISLAGKTTLTSQGAQLFPTYSAGDPLDPTAGNLLMESACGALPGGTGTSGGAGKATTGMGGMLAGLNDTLSEVNTLFGNTMDFMDNSEKLHGRVQDGSVTGATTGDAVSGTTTGGGGATTGDASETADSSNGANAGTTNGSGGGTTTTGTGVGHTAEASGTFGTANTPNTSTASGGEVCTDSGSLGVSSAQASWGIRSSFLNYISGGIAKGGWELSGVGEENGLFTFTGTSGAVDPANKSGTILFPGAIRFTGHGGVLDTRFSNLEIQFSGNAGALVLNASSNSTDGDPKDYGRVTLANLNFNSLQVEASSAGGTAEVTLTQAGSAAFGDFYPAGASLEPITFQAVLGGGASCASGQGGVASAAGVGGGAAAAENLRAGGVSGQASSSGVASSSVLDEAAFEGAVSSDSLLAADAGSQFKVKSTGGEGEPGTDRLMSMVLLIVAAFVVAGLNLGNFVRRNPASGR